MQIKKATLSEAAPLLIFAQNTFTATYAHLNEPVFFEQYVRTNFRIENIEAELQNEQIEYWIITENDTILAYIKLNINHLHDAETIIHDTQGSMSELERIYIAENQKGKGLGKIMIEKAIERAAFYQNDWLWLGVWEENSKALAFYKHLGFEIFGGHAFYMGDDRQDDFLMRIKIKET
jgi:diamine N-acetyltransferase